MVPHAPHEQTFACTAKAQGNLRAAVIFPPSAHSWRKVAGRVCATAVPRACDPAR